ncbi:MAG: ABC-F family ATP-binding cassette domain-containing protein [Defluviitaleaceae bacterium]|nr:ABC-F family ATP-binding cassette domain-containing protein [Defluviitaleaceae bacterium]
MLLQLKNIQKAIGVEEILTDVSFIVEEKEKIALVGVNGAGKTSVFRLLTGEWQADDGAITKGGIRTGGIRIGYLPQLNDETAVDFYEENHPNLYDALDSVFLPLKKMEAEIRSLEARMSGEKDGELEKTLKLYDKLSIRFKDEGGFEIESRVKGVLRGLGFGEERWKQSFNQLSGGERTRALLGKLLLEQNDLLLMDEPTNHLDIESIAWLEDYLKNFPGAVIVISHDRYFLDKVVTKTIEIENKKSAVYNGNYSHFVTKKATDRAMAEKAFFEQQKVLKHHEEVVKKIRSFKTEAAIIRAKSREKLIDKIERVEAPTAEASKMRLRLKPTINSGNDVLFAEEITMGFDNKTLFSDISFEVKKGDRTALIGANGIGKTTLIKILANILAPLSGRVREGVNVRIGYYDQSHTFSADSEKKSIFQEIADSYPRLSQTEIRTTLAAFMFIGDDVFKPISALSGGERGRVQLSKIMLAGANFLILDEPTNHLDIFSKEILEDALREFSGTLIYISHDRYFINNTATKILELTEKGITEYLGDYDYYLEKKATLPILPTKINESTPTSKESYLQKKELEAIARRKKSRIEKLEKEISETEKEIAQCDEKLLTDEINRDLEQAQRVFAEKTELEEKLTMLYEEWEELNETE